MTATAKTLCNRTTRQLLLIAALLLQASLAAAQSLEVLKINYPGRVLRDPAGNWIVVQDTGNGLRVIKFSSDFVSIVFDRRPAPEANRIVMDVYLDAAGNLFILGATVGSSSSS